MYSLKIAKFLFDRVVETITYRDYIKEISLDYELDESYGNEYIRLNYQVTINEAFKSLPFNKQEKMFRQDRRTIFPISTHAQLGKISQKQKLLKIIEFKQIYESLAAYIALQFESELNQETAIKIKGIDFWPEANYASKYLNEGLYVKYRDRGRWVFESDVRQWERLHRLAISSKKTYTKDKANFNITDASINELFDIEVESIRYLLLSYNIPIKIKGIKTIDKIYIHTVSLVEALKKEIKDKYQNGRRDSYKHLIAYLYDNYLSSEKLNIVASQKNIFIENFIIQSGDILQLKNGQIVVTNKIEIGKNNSVYITYAILKADLQLSFEKSNRTS
jgi:hypothetical protein